MGTIARPADGGRMHLPATRWGCAAQDFDFVHQVFNSRFQLSLSTVALPLPLTVEQWQVDIGNHYVLLGSMRDPRPTWNNDFRTIVAPSITAAGDVWHPVPPTVGVMQRRDAMHIGVSGDAQSGWVLAFDGDDGCFDVRVTATVRAGDGVLYPGTTWFAVGGESVTFGWDYARYVADCQALFEQWFQDYMKSLHPRAGVGNVKPGTPFEDIEQLVANVVHVAVNSGDAGAYGLMQAATARFGLGTMSALIGHRGGAPPHTTTKARPFPSTCTPCATVGVRLPYFNPHSFRTAPVQLGERLCPNPEDFKAWSQNLGHESVLTTLLSYGAVAPRRQGQIIQTLATGTAPPSGQAEVVAQAVVQALRGAGLLGGQG